MAGLVLLGPRDGAANGAFPAVSQLVVDPADPTHLVLRSNFGLLSSFDSGKEWSWICEGALGYLDIEPPIAVTTTGTTLLALPTGIVVVERSGCNFFKAAGIDANVTDLSIELAKPGGVLAVSVDFESNRSQVWESLDDGMSWEPLGTPISSFGALTIDAGRSDAERIYLSGLSGAAEPRGVLLTSTDHGDSWRASHVPYSDAARPPYIAAINPKSDDTVYVRLNGFPGSLSITEDAGQSWVEALSLPAPVQGFAVSPDGQTLLASTTTTGIYRASSGKLDFERVTCSGVACLSWGEAGLLGCGDETSNGFTLGRSADDGASFEPMLHATCVAPASCPSDSSAGKVCPSAWPMVAAKLGQNQNACDPDAPSRPFDVACLMGEGGASNGGAPSPGDGGEAPGEPEQPAGGSNDEPDVGGTAGTASSVGGTTSRDAPAPESSGCDCDFGGERSASAWYELALGLILMRRRR